MNDVSERAEGQRVWRVLWAGRGFILASVIVLLVLAWVYTSLQPKVYQATGILQVNVATNQPASSDTAAANQALAQDYATLLVSPGLLGAIHGNVDNGRLSAADLQSRISASAGTTSSLVRFEVKGSSPSQAQTLATQIADGFLSQLQSSATVRTSKLQTQEQNSIRSLEGQIQALQAKPASAANTQQIVTLKASLTELTAQNEALVASGLAQGTSATLAAPPVASSAPVSPHRSINLLGGLILGAIIGIALAWGRHMISPRLGNAADAQFEVDLPVLASVPLIRRPDLDDPLVMEAFRLLAARLLLTERELVSGVITIAGASPQVGKTTTVLELGRALAERGYRVVMVDGDMRSAALSAEVGETGNGMAELLRGTAKFDRAIVPVADNLSLLPSRRAATVNAAGLLGAPGARAMIERLRDAFDFVVIDTPPLTGLADGHLLASLSDAVVLVVRAGVSRPPDVRSVVSSLRQNSATVAGMVVFEAATSNHAYYPVYHGDSPGLKLTVGRHAGNGA